MEETPVWGDQETPCVHLRRKTMYVVQAQSSENRLYTNDMAEPHWCLKTMKIYGPDDKLAGPRKCLAGRECYNPGY